MRTTYGPPRLTVFDLPAGVTLPVFRIVRSDEPDDPVFLNSLRSHYELSEEPRRVERDSTAVHMGLSVFQRREDAEGTAALFPKIGAYTARLDLIHGRGFNYARTGMRGHLTLWADPIKLREVVVDVLPVEQ